MRILLIGIRGVMGEYVYNFLADKEEYQVVAGLDTSKYDLQEPKVYKKIEDVLEEYDLVIDFSSCEVFEALRYAISKGKKVLSGTTGFKREEILLLADLAKEKKTSFVWTPNFAYGSSVMHKIINEYYKCFNSFDLVESHSTKKKDFPSGTAKELARALDLKEEKVQVLRLHDVIATHEVIMNNDGEKLHIKHEIITRDAFNKGFLKALSEMKKQLTIRYGLDAFF